MQRKLSVIAGAAMALTGCPDNDIPVVETSQPSGWHDHFDVKLQLGERLGRHVPVMSYAFLPSTLQGGTLNDEPYFNTVSFADSGQPYDLFYLTQSDGARLIQGENERDVYGTYLHCDSNDVFMTATMQFSPPFEDYVEDTFPIVGLHGRMLNFMDDVYTIRSATRNADGVYMQWVAGNKYVLDEGDVATITGRQSDGYSRYYLEPMGLILLEPVDALLPPLPVSVDQLEVLIVNPSTLEAKYRINGEVTDPLQPGQWYALSDGRRIYQEAISSHNGTDCTYFYWDADVTDFHDSDITDNLPEQGAIVRNGEFTEDVWVRINGSFQGNDLELRSIEFALGADAVRGDVFIDQNNSLRDQLDEPDGIPGRRFDVRYIGQNGNTHTVRVGSTLGVLYDIEVQE